MPLTHSQISDFVTATIENFKRLKWTDISLDLQDYVAARLIDEKKIVEQGSDVIKFDIQTKNTGNARNTGLYAQDVTGVEDVLTQGSAPWTKQTVNWSYDIDEDAFQGDRETIVKLLVLREHDAMNSMAELNEENLWTAPTGTADIRPMGIPFWMQKDATTTPDGGFNGGNPSGFSAGAAGVDSTAYPKWRNWTFGYTNIEPSDLIRKTKKAMTFTKFKAPHPHPELGFSSSDNEIYTTYRVQEPLERLAESRNDNLGKDVAKYMNSVTIGGVPVMWVPYLEANDTSDPLYGVNWKYFRPYCKKGRTMVRHAPIQAPKQHTVREVHIDNWMNYVCYNRRALWVGSKA